MEQDSFPQQRRLVRVLLLVALFLFVVAIVYAYSALNTPTSLNISVHEGDVKLSISPAVVFLPQQEVLVHWNVTNIQELSYNGEGRSGTKDIPLAITHCNLEHEWRVVSTNGAEEQYSLSVNVLWFDWRFSLLISGAFIALFFALTFLKKRSPRKVDAGNRLYPLDILRFGFILQIAGLILAGYFLVPVSCTTDPFGIYHHVLQQTPTMFSLVHFVFLVVVGLSILMAIISWVRPEWLSTASWWRGLLAAATLFMMVVPLRGWVVSIFDEMPWNVPFTVLIFLLFSLIRLLRNTQLVRIGQSVVVGILLIVWLLNNVANLQSGVARFQRPFDNTLPELNPNVFHDVLAVFYDNYYGREVIIPTTENAWWTAFDVWKLRWTGVSAISQDYEPDLSEADVDTLSDFTQQTVITPAGEPFIFIMTESDTPLWMLRFEDVTYVIPEDLLPEQNVP